MATEQCNHMIDYCPLYTTCLKDMFLGWNPDLVVFRSLVIDHLAMFSYIFGVWLLRSGLEESSKKILLSGDNVAVPLPCTKAIVWCFCHQNLRWVDVLLTLIISGMVSDFKRLCGNDVAKAMIWCCWLLSGKAMYRTGLWGARHCQVDS